MEVNIQRKIQYKDERMTSNCLCGRFNMPLFFQGLRDILEVLCSSRTIIKCWVQSGTYPMGINTYLRDNHWQWSDKWSTTRFSVTCKTRGTYNLSRDANYGQEEFVNCPHWQIAADSICASSNTTRTNWWWSCVAVSRGLIKCAFFRQ